MFVYFKRTKGHTKDVTQAKLYSKKGKEEKGAGRPFNYQAMPHEKPLLVVVGFLG